MIYFLQGYFCNQTNVDSFLTISIHFNGNELHFILIPVASLPHSRSQISKLAISYGNGMWIVCDLYRIFFVLN